MKNVALVAACVLVQCLMTDCLFASQCHRFCGLNGSKCLRKFGLCLCDFGWTGPNGVFITSGPHEDRIIADYCIVRCQYSRLYRNPNCTGLSTPPPLPTEVMTGKSCHNRCGPNQLSGQCLPNNKCLCWWGKTGPNAVYINAGVYKNRIVADNCNLFCYYNHLHRNPDCVASKQQKECEPRCELFRNGECQSDGKCMCSWGWTGPNAVYVTKGKTTRIKADYCDVSCHYTNNFQNPRCSTQTKPTGISLSCDPRCEKIPGQGMCQSDGHCLCWWGWTGPNATYIVNGNLTNRIVADYCTKSCHYTHDYLNISCASIPLPRECSVTPNSSTPLPCKPQCGAGVYHGGECLSNGRCLCWWGWTGPNSCFVDGGEYNNRIVADYCTEACHYTHDYRNNSCTNKHSESTKSNQLHWSSLPSLIQNTSQPLNALTATKTVDDPTAASPEFNETQYSLKTEEPVTTKQLASTEEAADQSSTSDKWNKTEQPNALYKPKVTQQDSRQQFSTTAEFPTTDDPIITADNPIITTDDPIISTDDLNITTDDPIITTDDPIITTDDPNITTDDPVIISDDPIITTDDPIISTDDPIITTDERSSEQLPSKAGHQSATSELPSKADHQSNQVDQQYTTTDQPTTKENLLHTTKTNLVSTAKKLLISTELPNVEQQATTIQRMFTTEQPMATGQKLTTTEHTSTTEHNPTTTETPSTTIEPWPLNTETKPIEQNHATTEHFTTTKHQPTTIETQSTKVKKLPTPIEQQPTTTGQNLRSIEHFTTTEQPGTTQEPATTDHSLTTLEQKTTLSSKQQIITSEQKLQAATTKRATSTEEKYTITEQLFTTKEQHTTTDHLMPTLTTTITEPQEINPKPKHHGSVPSGHVLGVDSHEENISSPSAGNSIALAIGIIAIVCALTGLVFMMRYNMKCPRTRTGYSKLGEEAYFLNEQGTNHDF